MHSGFCYSNGNTENLNPILYKYRLLKDNKKSATGNIFNIQLGRVHRGYVNIVISASTNKNDHVRFVDMIIPTGFHNQAKKPPLLLLQK